MKYGSRRLANDPHWRGRYAARSNCNRRDQRDLCGQCLFVRLATARSHRVTVQNMLDHAAGELVLAEENLAGFFLLEQCRFFFAVRAHDGLDARIDGARDLDHAAHVEGVRRGDHQHARAVNVGLNQHIGIGSVAGDGRNAALAELLDDFAILFGDDEGLCRWR